MQLSDNSHRLTNCSCSKYDNAPSKSRILLWVLVTAVFLLFVTIYMIGFIMEPKTRYYNHQKGIQQILNTIFINPILKTEDTMRTAVSMSFKIIYEDGSPCIGKNVEVTGGSKLISKITDIHGLALLENLRYGQNSIQIKDRDGTILGECELEITLLQNGMLSIKANNSEFQARTFVTEGNITYLEIELTIDSDSKSVSLDKGNISYLTEQEKFVTPEGSSDVDDIFVTPGDVTVLPDGTVVAIREYPDGIKQKETVIITKDGDVIIITDDGIIINGAENPSPDEIDSKSDIELTPDGGIKTPDGTIITPDGDIIPPQTDSSSADTTVPYENTTNSSTDYTEPSESESGSEYTGSEYSESTEPSEPTGSSDYSEESTSPTKLSESETESSEPSQTDETKPTKPSSGGGGGSSAESGNSSTDSSEQNPTKPTQTDSTKEYPKPSGDVTVYQGDTAWSQLSTIDIFNDIDKLYPGASGSYIFRIVNTNSFDVEFTFHVTEKEHPAGAIPLLYKLKKGGEYIVGSAGNNGWVTSDYLKDVKVPLGAGCDISYEIEWKWMYESGNDAYDTAIGSAEDLIHKFYFKIYIEQTI